MFSMLLGPQQYDTVLGCLPPAGLIAFLSWPFLVVWLLWASGRLGRVSDFAGAGAVLGFLGLFVFPQGSEPVEIVFLAVETALPAILFWVVRGGDRARVFYGAVGERLPFLVVGCALMALCLRSALVVTVFIGAGTVMLAWWDGRVVRRAMAAWMMVRLRLSGVILGALGAALLQEIPLQTGNDAGHATQIIGSTLLIVGLGMMASLGSRVVAAPVFGILDVGLRFAALGLMARLSVYPLARPVMLVAALAAMIMVVSGRGRSLSLLPFLTVLGEIAAAYEQEVALLWLYLASLLVEGVRLSFVALPETFLPEQELIAEKAVLPVIGIVLVMIGQKMPWEVLVPVLLCTVLGMRHVSFSGGVLHPLAFWGQDTALAQVFVLLLFFLAFMGVFVMAWHPSLLWHP